MDWFGDKLSKLIAEGKRALGAEVVVMSEAKEDEIDDGAEGWEEEEAAGSSSFSSRRSSRHTAATPRTLTPSSSSDPLPIRNASPSRSYVSQPSSPNISGRWKPERASYGLDSPSILSVTTRENESDWQSNELRESMERARAALLRRRTTTGAEQ